MRVLIGCEFSGIVRDAFKEQGHEAWSCDLLPTERPGKHFQYDLLTVLECIGDEFDLAIFHPPCTYLANSGVQHLWNERKKEKGKNISRWQKMEEAKDFFMTLLNFPIKRLAVENPIPHGYAKLPPYSQIIQPYEHGHEVQKKTCLWLKNLPLLKSTNIVGKGEQYIGKDGKPNGSKWYQLPPTIDRWKQRSRTFEGVAKAMATQWGNL